MRGHRITRESGDLLAADIRQRRFEFKSRRGRRPPMPAPSGARHFKTPTGGIPAFNATTNLLGQATCQNYVRTSSNFLTYSGNDEVVLNQWGAIPGGIFVLAVEGDDGSNLVIPPQAEIGLYQFTLTAALSGSSASATIKTMAGTTVGSLSVSDPAGIFTGLASGKSGICILQGGVYYIYNAKC